MDRPPRIARWASFLAGVSIEEGAQDSNGWSCASVGSCRDTQYGHDLFRQYHYVIGDHGGFARDDTNVILPVANPTFTAQTVSNITATT